MTLAFAIIAALTIIAAVAAMTLRNLVHCALALVGAFAGLAAAYLQLNAQFVGFAQILVYVGAVAILVVFAILLTRGSETAQQSVVSSGWIWGIGTALAVLVALVWAVNNSVVLKTPISQASAPTVKEIGDALMTKFVLPLEVTGLLLTAALIGAVIIAMKDEPEEKNHKSDNSGSIDNRQPAIGNHP